MKLTLTNEEVEYLAEITGPDYWSGRTEFAKKLHKKLTHEFFARLESVRSLEEWNAFIQRVRFPTISPKNNEKS